MAFVLREGFHVVMLKAHMHHREMQTGQTGRPGAAQKLVSTGRLGNGWCVISVTPDSLRSGSKSLS